jgi:hypothetical protein
MVFAKPYSPRTGTVFIEAFDQGVLAQIAKLGSQLVYEPVTGKPLPSPGLPDYGPGGKQPAICNDKSYFVEIAPPVPGKPADVVFVIMGNPEQALVASILPMIVVRRDSIQPDMKRWNSFGHIDYFQGVSGSIEVQGNVSGFSLVETKPQAMPYELSYTISIYARLETQALRILRRLLRRFPPYGAIPVIDSLKEQRTYTTYNDSSVSDISEIVDVSERTRGYSFSIRVEGELDLYDEDIRSTVSTVQVQSEKTN